MTNIDKATKLKEKVAKEANKIMKKGIASLQKELNNLLKKNGFWYSSDETIKQYDDLHKINDRNADQLMLENFKDIIFINQGDDCFQATKASDLWSKEDIYK